MVLVRKLSSANSELWSCSLAEDREPLIRNPPNADAVVKNLNLTFEAVWDSECDILKAQIKMKLVCMHGPCIRHVDPAPFIMLYPSTLKLSFPAQARSCARRPASARPTGGASHPCPGTWPWTWPWTWPGTGQDPLPS